MLHCIFYSASRGRGETEQILECREREREKKKIHNFMNKKKYSLSNYRTGFAMIAL